MDEDALSPSAGEPSEPKPNDKPEDDSAPTRSAQPEASSASTKGRAASQGRVKKGNLGLDLAQMQWLRTMDNGAFLENDTIKLLRSTKPKSKYPYIKTPRDTHEVASCPYNLLHMRVTTLHSKVR